MTMKILTKHRVPPREQRAHWFRILKAFAEQHDFIVDHGRENGWMVVYVNHIDGSLLHKSQNHAYSDNVPLTTQSQAAIAAIVEWQYAA